MYRYFSYFRLCRWIITLHYRTKTFFFRRFFSFLSLVNFFVWNIFNLNFVKTFFVPSFDFCKVLYHHLAEKNKEIFCCETAHTSYFNLLGILCIALAFLYRSRQNKNWTHKIIIIKHYHDTGNSQFSHSRSLPLSIFLSLIIHSFLSLLICGLILIEKETCEIKSENIHIFLTLLLSFFSYFLNLHRNK